MDYTTSANLKAALGITGAGEDTFLAQCITRASRMLDRYLTNGAVGSDNYLLSETVTAETVRGLACLDGLIAYPHKPLVTTVTAMAWHYVPRDGWETVDVVNDVSIEKGAVLAWVYPATGTRPFVRMTYTGGLAADVASLPADVVEAANTLAARFFREAKSGLTDVIGVNELGVLMYAKSLPERVRLMLQPYVRVVPW